MNTLDKAIEHAGGVSALAELLDIGQPTISNWKTRGVPAKRFKQIEKALNGAVTLNDFLNEFYQESAA